LSQCARKVDMEQLNKAVASWVKGGESGDDYI